MSTPRTPHTTRCAARPDTRWLWHGLLGGLIWTLGVSGGAGAAAADHAATPDHAEPAASPKTAVKKALPAQPADAASAAHEPSELAIDLKKALRDQMIERKKLTLVISDRPELVLSKSNKTSPPARPSAPSASHADTTAMPAHAAPAPAAARAPVAVAKHRVVAQRPVSAVTRSRSEIQAKAAALAGHASDSHGAAHGDVHWSYTGDTGPQAWGQLKPEFSTCATGQRQTPINIEESATLQGPAEPLRFNYQPSGAVVQNNGHTIQVNLQGNNTLTVRGSTYTLVQFHFHTPSEEQVNHRSFAMVAHLVHKNPEGQLAVVAVLLDAGEANALIDKVWTYMPLDVRDEVRTPDGLIDLDELLPKDQRYYQFIGSLTTPPCTEGVLWMVLKTPAQISPAQLRLFQQLYPNNARPVQAVNNRPVRNALTLQ